MTGGVQTMLAQADARAQDGWIGDALNDAHAALTRAIAAGASLDVQQTLTAFHEALRATHWDTTMPTFNARALHTLYLACIGALTLDAAYVAA